MWYCVEDLRIYPIGFWWTERKRGWTACQALQFEAKTLDLHWKVGRTWSFQDFLLFIGLPGIAVPDEATSDDVAFGLLKHIGHLHGQTISCHFFGLLVAVYF
jgi:hypothetical protein